MLKSKGWGDELRRVKGVLMRLGCSSSDADDLVQEAWLRRACYALDQTVERPEQFLMRTSLNLFMDQRKSLVSRGKEVPWEEVVLIDTAPAVETVVLARERIARLGQCLERLTPKARAILLAYRIDGLTCNQVAGHFGMRAGTVEKLVDRTTRKLAVWMKDW